MKNKIVFVTESMVTIGGVVRVISSWSNFFANRDTDVEIVSVHPGPPYFTLSEKIRFSNCNFMFRRKWLKLLSIPLNTIKMYFFLKNRENANVIFNKSLYIEPLWILRKLGFKFQSNLIYMHHGGSKGFRSFYLSRLSTKHRVAMMFSAFDKVICLYDDENDYPDAVDVGKLHFIPNPIPFAANEMQTNGKKNEILSIGRITHAKGIDTLIRAWSLVEPHVREDWVLKIVGDGPDKQEFKELAASLKLTGLEFYEGTPDVQPYYESAQLFVIPSEVEGFGMTIIEAMAHGCCVVSTKTLGGIELIDHDITGVLVDIGDTAGLARKLSYTMQDTKYRADIICNAQRFVGKYDIVRLSHKWDEILN